MKKAIITIVFLISFLIPFSTNAQDIEKRWEFGLGGGYYTGTQDEDGLLRLRDPNIESYERLIGSYDASLDSDPIFYLNCGYRFKDYGFFRIQVGYMEFNIDLKRELFDNPDANVIGKLDAIPINFNFNYFLMRKTPFKPYLSAGFSTTTFIDSQELSISPSIRLGATIGLGLEYYFTDTFALTADLAYHFLKIELDSDDPFMLRGYPQTYEEVNAIPDRVELVLGIKFLVN